MGPQTSPVDGQKLELRCCGQLATLSLKTYGRALSNLVNTCTSRAVTGVEVGPLARATVPDL